MNKTYEVWASNGFEKHLITDNFIFIGLVRDDHHKHKVTITFHEEKKVTITESEFDEYFGTHGVVSINMLKDKLFNQKEGE